MADNESNIPGPEGESSPEKHRDPQKETSIEEYRLVPVEEARYYDEDEKIIDFVGVATDIWDHRKAVLKIFLAFILLGTLLFTFKERTYYSETSLMPETRTGTQLTRLLQQYQGLLGLQPQTQQRDELSVNLYPEIVESLPFLVELVQQEIYFEEYDRTITIYDYFNEVREQTMMQKAGAFLWDMTFGLPRTIAGLFRSSSESGEFSDNFNFEQFLDLETPQKITPRLRKAMEGISNWTTVRIEPQTGFIQIGVSMPEARASAEAVNVVKEQLTRYVTEYRIEKAVQDLEYIQGQFETAEEQYQQAQEELAEFMDRNINLSTARSQMMEQRLQSRYNHTYDVYNSLAMRLEEARIKVQEETPVFRIYEPVTISSRPSEPNAKRIFFGSAFLGLFFGIGSIYFRRGYYRFRDEFRNRRAL